MQILFELKRIDTGGAGCVFRNLAVLLVCMLHIVLLGFWTAADPTSVLLGRASEWEKVPAWPRNAIWAVGSTIQGSKRLIYTGHWL